MFVTWNLGMRYLTGLIPRLPPHPTRTKLSIGTILALIHFRLWKNLCRRMAQGCSGCWHSGMFSSFHDLCLYCPCQHILYLACKHPPTQRSHFSM